MNTEQKNAAGELLAIAGGALFFLCAMPVAYLLVLTLAGAYSIGTFISVFLQLPEMLLWWTGVLTCVMCFRFRRVVLGSQKP
ncbi:hypothetical protein [Pseudomonas sp. S2_H10]